MDKKTYDKLSKKWEGKVYQKRKKLKKRLPIIIENMDFFRDSRVLELGSNAGMYAYMLLPYIKSYTGIEMDSHYYKQSLETLQRKDVTLINKRFSDVDLDEIDFDLFLASYVLHHLSPDEVNKLDIVFKKCKKVAIHTRCGDPLMYGHDEIGYDPIPHWDNSLIREHLEHHGFSCSIHLTGKYDYNGIYLILAEK